MKTKIIKKPARAHELIAHMKQLNKRGKLIGFDIETTALFPEPDNLQLGPQVRLSQFCWGDTVYIIDHFFAGSFSSMVDDIIDVGTLYVFNNSFEGRWMDAFASSDATDKIQLFDVGHMRRSVRGGGPLSLKMQVKFDLNIVMDKELQMSDWSAPTLASEQYKYAALDAYYTQILAVRWHEQMSDSQWNGFFIINDSWRAVNEIQDTGMQLDVTYHKTLIKMWEKRRTAGFKSLRKIVSEKHLKNIRSKKQLSEFLKTVVDDAAVKSWPKTAKTKQLKTDRNILRSVSYNSPYPFSRFLAAMMVFSRADKYLSTYGETLVTKQILSGGIFGRLNPAQAITGRFSSSGPNMQNIPRSPAVRRSFVASPGCSMVIADYSGIELRVLAELSDDAQMRKDVIYGDLHAENAAAMYKISREHFIDELVKKNPIMKELRAKAKAFSFQLTYGAGMHALAMSLRATPEKSAEFVSKWAARYPAAYGYREIMFGNMKTTGYLNLKSGRTILVPHADRTMPVASNYPIQGAAADVMYRALTRLEVVLRHSDIPAWLSASIHDEIILVVENRYDYVKRAEVILREQMVLGWLDIFPNTITDNLLESAYGPTWASKP